MHNDDITPQPDQQVLELVVPTGKPDQTPVNPVENKPGSVIGSATQGDELETSSVKATQDDAEPVQSTVELDQSEVEPVQDSVEPVQVESDLVEGVDKQDEDQQVNEEPSTNESNEAAAGIV